ncbi:MAG: O-antigen ligase family protein [Candidatus Eremiobacteraeota bacterium]|nr:O-antigen ligase family protein [Candidatus Eremiobacteraeota bacterium]
MRRKAGEFVHNAAFAFAAYAIVFAASIVSGARAPRYGVALLIALVPYALYFDAGATTLTLSKFALVGLTIGLLIYRVPLETFRAAAFLRLFAAAALVVLTTAISISYAEFTGPAVRETLKACEYLLLFIVVYTAARVDPDPQLQKIIVALSVLVVAIMALAQEWHGAPSQLATGGVAVPRIAGTLEGPNQLAGYLGIALPLLAAFCVQRFDALIATATFSASAALVLTFSRGGIVATIVAVAIVLFLSRASALRTAITFVAGLAAGFACVATWAFATRMPPIFWFWTLESTNPGGVGTHGALWRAAIMQWRAHPWFGIGAGNFEYRLSSAGIHGVKTHANSLYLQNLAEQGIFGIAATFFLIWQSIAAFVRDLAESPFALGAFAASIGLALHQIVDLMIFYPKVGAWWWIVMALGAAAATSRKDAPTAEAAAS